MQIIIENTQGKVAIDSKIERLIEEAVVTTLQIEGFDVESEISIILVDDCKIKDINREHRKIDKATDVLSFPIADMFEGHLECDFGDCDLDQDLLLLGDIVISMETASLQAQEYGHSLERELAFLITHGMFHLLGYDHMKEEKEKIMIDKQEQVLTKMGLVRE